jgi:hypothetical protein
MAKIEKAKVAKVKVANTKVSRTCDSYNCARDHLLHLDGEWPEPFGIVLVGGERPYLNVRDAKGVIASIDGAALRRLGAAILRATRKAARRQRP